MGLVSLGRAIFQGGRAVAGRLFAGPPPALTAGAPEAAVAVGRRLLAPAVAGGAGLGLGGFLGSLFGGGGANGAVAPVGAAPMLPAARGAGGSTFVTLDDGSRVLMSPSGNVARPQLFLPAGAKLPAGATIVSISPGGDLFGIRRRRKRRTFAGEIDRCRASVSAARGLIKAVGKK